MITSYTPTIILCGLLLVLGIATPFVSVFFRKLRLSDQPEERSADNDAAEGESAQQPETLLPPVSVVIYAHDSARELERHLPAILTALILLELEETQGIVVSRLIVSGVVSQGIPITGDCLVELLGSLQDHTHIVINLGEATFVLLQSSRRLVLLHGIFGFVLIEKRISEVEVRDGIRVVLLNSLLILNLSLIVNTVSH